MSRRSLLAAGAAGLTVSASGCISRVESIVGEDAGRLSVSISVVPDDDDRQAIDLARALESNLEAVGVDVSIDLRTKSELLGAVLLEHDFDMYVGRFPLGPDPDLLYELLHSEFANEIGWQNPFGYTNLTVDRALEEQRTEDDDARQTAIESVLDDLVREKPFISVCTPNEYRVVQSDRFAGWDETLLPDRLGYLGLEQQGDDGRLTGIITDSRPTRNSNLFAAHYRDHGTITDLLYDSLATRMDDELVPWLAESWEWDDGELTITVRPDCRFHDGEPLTAADLAFTFEFLTDTTLGRADLPVAPTRYRRQASAIEAVALEGIRTCTVTTDTGRAVAEQLLTVPILPEHVWREVVEDADDDEIPVGNDTWSVLFSDAVPRIGSGPYLFADRSSRDRLVLERFDDHFTTRDDVDLPAPTAEQLRLLNDPGSASAIQQVEAGRADVTLSALETHVIDRAKAVDDFEAVESPAQSFYHVGFNTRSTPFSDPYFRRVVAGLLDREWIVDEVFDGYADPMIAPVADEWIPDDLEWDGEDPVTPFYGTDGELDTEAAKNAFHDAGYRYDREERLVVNG